MECIKTVCIQSRLLVVLTLLHFGKQDGISTSFLVVTHPSYAGKTLSVPQENVLVKYVSMALDFADHKSEARFSFDTKCRYHCIKLGDRCKVLQTYWTSNQSLVCELLSTSLCYSCPAVTLIDGTREVADGQIWEVNPSSQLFASTPCVEQEDWQIKGNCSDCGRIGYYGRNCSLRSSCSSYYYEPGSSMSVSTMKPLPIAPCFTKGLSFTAFCRGPYTLWFTVGSATQNNWWKWNTGDSQAAFLQKVPEQMTLASQLLSRKHKLMVLAVGLRQEYNFYKNFSLSADGSLYLQSLFNSTSEGFGVPQSNAPFLQPLNASCGPMWLLDTRVFHNETYLDSCALPTRIFGHQRPMFAGTLLNFISLFVDINYFQCLP